MLIAPKWLKQQTSSLACMFPGSGLADFCQTVEKNAFSMVKIRLAKIVFAGKNSFFARIVTRKKLLLMFFSIISSVLFSYYFQTTDFDIFLNLCIALCI